MNNSSIYKGEDKVNAGNNIFVNGPVNAIRMEGEIDGIKKILYLFADIHMDINNQTECDSIRSLELKDYFLKNFDGLDENEMVDLFVEIKPEEFAAKKQIYREPYAINLKYFFKKCFNYDEEKNKVYTSTILPNVRFHYMDIRNLIFNTNENLRLHQIFDYYISLKLTPDVNECDELLKILLKALDNLNNIYELLYIKNKDNKKEEKNVFKIYYDFDIYVAENILKKTHEANSKYVKNILNNIKNTHIRSILIKSLSSLKKNIDLIALYKKEYFDNSILPLSQQMKNIDIQTKIYKELYYFCEVNGHAGILLTDMYFLRRYLDKKYITTGIIYSGIQHTLNCVFLLIKYFNFKMTNVSFCNEKIETVTNRIKNTEEDFDIMELYKYFIEPGMIYQCSNLSGFPENFK